MKLDIAKKDTICALSTASGTSAIAVIRVSGSKAFHILQTIFKSKSNITPRYAHHGEIVDENGKIIDDAIAIYFKKGSSFTGEESFEINCHGNKIIVDEILKSICEKGARLAQPGEFSMRAFLNKKIDLAQAESIFALIHAKSTAAKEIALKTLKGGLYEKTIGIRKRIISMLAEIEARMDFVEDDLGDYDKSHIVQLIDKELIKLDTLLKNANVALKLHEGARVVICGAPNAGKSTLLNRLCESERAIVHETAGTTRDVIECEFFIKGMPITLVDVAGIRSEKESEPIEQIGIKKALAELKKAHVIIWLADINDTNAFQDENIKDAISGLNVSVLKVGNKKDALKNWPYQSQFVDLLISAKTGDGINDLVLKLESLLNGENANTQELFITKARQKEELSLAQGALLNAKEALQNNLIDEVIAQELRHAGYHFDSLFGTEMNEEILDQIFSKFCIGK